MKKAVLSLLVLLLSSFLFAQKNTTVNVNNEIYRVIDNAQMRGLCKPVSQARPYTEKYILSVLDEILENNDKLLETEIKIIQVYIDENTKINEEKQFGSNHFSNTAFSVPIDFGLYYGLKTEASAAVFFNNTDLSAWAFNFAPNFSVKGDYGNFLGFNFNGEFSFEKVPLVKNGIGIAEDKYYIGDVWYPSHLQNGSLEPAGRNRYISSYSNNAWLPYTHQYYTSGQYGWISKLIPDRFANLKEQMTMYGNFYTEIHASFLEDQINIGFGRMAREWAAMDTGSSLVLNRTAVPFYGIDFNFTVAKWLKYSFLTGNLENPNRPDLLRDNEDVSGHWYPGDDNSDAFYFQNSFSLQMVEMNFGNFHIDFGSSVVYPKRFELGYLFPLTVLVEYQNHVGDYDNVAMFGDLKYTWPGYGYVWCSLFTDEINDFKTNPLTGTREMFAIQTGVKAVIPKVPFGTVTMRYTKIEPFCYTHHAINYVPYYEHYICENYTNNGLSLGSYLPPNTDEILIRFDAQPKDNITTSIAYQLTRHGAEYGTQQVIGSSLYSELDNKNRDDFYKYFLHDGAYNWIHALSANAAYFSKQGKVPFKVDVSLGLIISYFTGLDSSVASLRDSHGQIKNVNFDTPYSILDTEEYPFKVGPVLSIGFTVGKF